MVSKIYDNEFDAVTQPGAIIPGYNPTAITHPGFRYIDDSEIADVDLDDILELEEIELDDVVGDPIQGKDLANLTGHRVVEHAYEEITLVKDKRLDLIKVGLLEIPTPSNYNTSRSTLPAVYFSKYVNQEKISELFTVENYKSMASSLQDSFVVIYDPDIKDVKGRTQSVGIFTDKDNTPDAMYFFKAAIDAFSRTSDPAVEIPLTAVAGVSMAIQSYHRLRNVKGNNLRLLVQSNCTDLLQSAKIHNGI